MPRGFHRCQAETTLAYKLGLLLDHKKRSFIGAKPDGSLHLLLWGADKLIQHDRVMTRDGWTCQGCKPKHYIGQVSQWDHVNHKLWNRCDDLGNARTVCEGYHRARHLHRKHEVLPGCPGILADNKFAALLNRASP
jgi:hypothetical protein